MPHARSYAALIMGATLTLFLPTLSFAEGQSSSESSGLPPAHGYLAESGLQQFTSIIGSLRNATPHSSSSKGKAMRLFSRLYKTGGADVRELLDTFVHQLTVIVNQKWSATRSKDTKLVILIEDSKYALKGTLAEECDISDEMIDDMMQELYTAVSPTLGDYLASVKRTALIISAVVLSGLAIWGGYVAYNKIYERVVTKNIEKLSELRAQKEKEYKEVLDYFKSMRFQDAIQSFERLSGVIQEINNSSIIPQINTSAALSLRNQDEVMRAAGYQNGRSVLGTDEEKTRVVDVIERPGVNEVITSSPTFQQLHDPDGHPVYSITEYENPDDRTGTRRRDVYLQKITENGRTVYREYASCTMLQAPNGQWYPAADAQPLTTPRDWRVLYSTTQTVSFAPNPRTGEHDAVRMEPSVLDALASIAQSGVLQATAEQLQRNFRSDDQFYARHGYAPGMTDVADGDTTSMTVDGREQMLYRSRTMRADGRPILPGEQVPPHERYIILPPPSFNQTFGGFSNPESIPARTLIAMMPALQNPRHAAQQVREGLNLPDNFWQFFNPWRSGAPVAPPAAAGAPAASPATT